MKANDYNSLFFLLSCSGDEQKLKELGDTLIKEKKFNLAF